MGVSLLLVLRQSEEKEEDISYARQETWVEVQEDRLEFNNVTYWLSVTN